MVERILKMHFSGKFFGNDDWNYYHQKTETNLKHGIRHRKVFGNNLILYIVEKVLRNAIEC